MSKKRSGKHISGDPRKRSQRMNYPKTIIKDSSVELTDFETDYNGERCCICGGPLNDPYGHNPHPFPMESGERCCEKCNSEVVIPLRFSQMRYFMMTSHSHKKEGDRDITPKDDFCVELLRKLSKTTDLMEMCRINKTVQERTDEISDNPFKDRRMTLEEMFERNRDMLDEDPTYISDIRNSFLMNLYILIELKKTKKNQTITFGKQNNKSSTFRRI